MEYFSIRDIKQTQIIQKKSKFIATLIPVENTTDIEEKLQEIRKKHHDARHNCYAYRILENNKIVERASDDGEPSGTAGAPLLEQLRGYNMVNCIIIVTRYFGGILLGTGGLVKAYSQVACNVLKMSENVKLIKVVLLQLTINYSELEKLKYYLKTINGEIEKIDYKNDIELIIKIPYNGNEKFTNNYSNFPFLFKNCKKIEERNGYISTKNDKT